MYLNDPVALDSMLTRLKRNIDHGIVLEKTSIYDTKGNVSTTKQDDLILLKSKIINFFINKISYYNNFTIIIQFKYKSICTSHIFWTIHTKSPPFLKSPFQYRTNSLTDLLQSTDAFRLLKR